MVHTVSLNTTVFPMHSTNHYTTDEILHKSAGGHNCYKECHLISQYHWTLGCIKCYHTASLSITRHHWLSHCIMECQVASLNSTQHQWTTQSSTRAAHDITELHRVTLDTALHHWVLISLTMVSMILLPFGQVHKSMCGFWILSVNSRSSSSLNSRTSSATCIYR